MMVLEVVLPLFFMLTNYESIYQVNSQSRHICMGEFHKFFIDNEYPSMAAKRPCYNMSGPLETSLCFFSFSIYVALTCNLFEFFFYFRCMLEIKKHNESASLLFTAERLNKRKRYVLVQGYSPYLHNFLDNNSSTIGITHPEIDRIFTQKAEIPQNLSRNVLVGQRYFWMRFNRPFSYSPLS